MNEIPIIKDVDVIVVGGATGGVAAAVAAAQAGARVFVAAAESYFGEDLCATGALWLPTGDTEALDEWFGPAAPYRPMVVKEALDRALLNAGVDFLFGCLPVDVLRDGAGDVAGVVLGTRSGLVAVHAKAIVDVTPRAAVARAAGLPFQAWEGGRVEFTRVVLGHRAESDSGSEGSELSWRVVAGHPVKGEIVEEDLPVFAYTMEVPMPDGGPGAFAEAEQVVRDATWHRDQAWGGDRCLYVPPDRLDTVPIPWAGCDTAADAFQAAAGLFVLSPGGVLTQKDAAELLKAGVALRLGTNVGLLAAEFAKGREAQGGLYPGLYNREAPTAGVHEELRSIRYATAQFGAVPAARDLPTLDAVDIVVAGGGTGGAPAGIAAAREGANALVLESLPALGGVATLGLISVYYHGYREGFTREVDRGVGELGQDDVLGSGRWNPEHKSEWFRRTLRAAGGRVWHQAVVTGAVMAGNRVTGVVVATPHGYGIVRAGAVLDCTGNADVAAAAGAQCRMLDADHIAVQGSGMPPRHGRPGYTNTDYTFVEDADLADATRALVVGRRKFHEAFDMGQMVDTRERRQIVGDREISPLDVYAGRTWPDSVAVSRSNFDTHGFTIHPLFLVKPPDRESLDAWLSIGALLPRGLDGVLVTGLGLSGHRDVMPVLRMQACVQNHSYAAALAAVASLQHNGDVRSIDLPALQRRLVELEILPPEALEHTDSFPAVDADLRAAAQGALSTYRDLALLLAHPERALPLLREAYGTSADEQRRQTAAMLLAAMGDATGAQALLDLVPAEPWDDGWNYRGMGQFGASMSEQDRAIVLLSMCDCVDALSRVLEKASSLDADHAFSHHRAVALFCEHFGDHQAAPVLADVLRKPGMSGHAWTSLADELQDIPESHVDTSTRNRSLRELVLARALYRCGDLDGLGKRILERYKDDIHGPYARHARAVLKSC